LGISAVSFFALAGYVTVESLRALTGAAEADHSPVGIGLAAVSLLVMPVLSYAQRRAGREYGRPRARHVRLDPIADRRTHVRYCACGVERSRP